MFKKCASRIFRQGGWTIEYDDMNATFEVQDQSLDWLDSVSHLLEDYGGSRTDAFSGIKVEFG